MFRYISCSSDLCLIDIFCVYASKRINRQQAAMQSLKNSLQTIQYEVQHSAIKQCNYITRNSNKIAQYNNNAITTQPKLFSNTVTIQHNAMQYNSNTVTLRNVICFLSHTPIVTNIILISISSDSAERLIFGHVGQRCIS